MAKRRVTDAVLARQVLEFLKERQGAAPVRDENNLWTFNRGIGAWERTHPMMLRQWIQNYPTKGVSAALMEGAAKILEVLVFNPTFFVGAPYGASLAGQSIIITLNQRNDLSATIKQAEPEDRLRVAWPDVKFARLDRPPPCFATLLNDLWQPDEDREEKTALLGHYLGACLLGYAALLQTTIFLHGRVGQNGKSVLLETLKTLFPPEMVTAIEPKDFESDYHCIKLLGARINIVDEISPHELGDSTRFKEIVAGGFFTARELRQSTVSFNPVAGHWFGMNQAPALGDPGPAFWRRIKMLTFNRRFEKVAANVELVAKATADHASIINWAITCALKALEENRMALPNLESSNKAVEEWRISGDQVANYLNERMEACTDSKERAGWSETYDDYRRWAIRFHHGLLSGRSFQERMIDHGHVLVNGKSGRVFASLKFKSGIERVENAFGKRRKK